MSGRITRSQSRPGSQAPTPTNGQGLPAATEAGATAPNASVVPQSAAGRKSGATSVNLVIDTVSAMEVEGSIAPIPDLRVQNEALQELLRVQARELQALRSSPGSSPQGSTPGSPRTAPQPAPVQTPTAWASTRSNASSQREAAELEESC